MGRKWGWTERLVALTGAVVAATLTALLTVTVLDSVAARHDAVSSLQTARLLTTRRVDKLNHEIAALSGQNATAARQRGRLLEEVRALSAQLREMGATPIVAPRTSTAPAPSAAPPPSSGQQSGHPTTRPSRSPSRHPSPRPTPTPKPTPCLSIPVLGCLP